MRLMNELHLYCPARRKHKHYCKYGDSAGTFEPNLLQRQFTALKPLQKWTTEFNRRGKNIVLECLQFGGNKEFWKSFHNEDEIYMYFRNCYAFAVNKVGHLHTDENIICAVIVTELNRRNLFVYYLPITDKWQVKVMSNNKSEKGNKLQQYDKLGNPVYTSMKNVDRPRLSHSEFWKQRGGLISYSNLQEDFYTEISKCYGAKRGESLSLIKNTTPEQRDRFNRRIGDDYDELYFDDTPYG